MPPSDFLLDAVRSLAVLASELADLESEERALHLAEQIPDGRINLIVAGQFKRGKSSLVNAFLGTDLMPTGALPLTGVATGIRYGEEPKVEVRVRNEERARIVPPTDLQLYVTETFNPHNRLNVERIDVTWPSERLRGIALFDTPGVGSVYERNTAAAFAALPRADAAILVVGPEPPVGREEREYAREVVASSERLFVVLNKSDLAGESLGQVLDFTRRSFAEALALDIEVIPVSATRARSAQDAGAEDLEFARLLGVLRSFVADSGRATLDASLRRRATSVVERLDALASLRLSALRMPGEERRRRREALEEALQIVDDRARPLELALDDDVSRIRPRLEDRLDRMHDRDAESFKANATVLGSLRSREEREDRFEELLGDVVSAWRVEALALADDELRTCGAKNARLAADIVRCVWRAGLDAANLDPTLISEHDLTFSPASLKLVASLVPTTGLELLVGFATDMLPPPMRREALTRRYNAILEGELDSAKGKLRCGIARDLDAWRRSARETMRSTIGHARSVVVEAFQERDGSDDGTCAVLALEDAHRRIRAVRESIANAATDGAAKTGKA